MKFNVDGVVCNLTVRQWQANCAYDDMPEETEAFFEEYLEFHQKGVDGLYRLSRKVFDEMAFIGELQAENVRMHDLLTAEQCEVYDDWEMLRCIKPLVDMVQGANDYLKEMLGI